MYDSKIGTWMTLAKQHKEHKDVYKTTTRGRIKLDTYHGIQRHISRENFIFNSESLLYLFGELRAK